ncbi:unnamed protein product [Miscanthus lutarioriparius]|uniref:Uncharacterized protein n=1 Tax=Miscanthus lutarioriparius TaxID=422564 RepID=A0A811QE83_9POAL|nr:unnamed protein product [Miscanthus lutarioriparius]
MKVKLLFPYAVSCVFGGMGRAWGMAMVGLHVVLCIIKVLSFTTDPEVARFWVPIFRVWVYLGIAAIVLMTCVNIVYYMPVYGVYTMNYDLPPQQPAAAVVATPEQLHLLLRRWICVRFGRCVRYVFDCWRQAPLEIWKMLQVLLVLLLNGINGKDQRAEKIVLSLAPPVKAKIEDRWWHTSVKAHHLTKELGHAVLAEQSRKLIKDSHRCLVLLDDYPLLDARIWEHFDVAAPCIVLLLFDKWINGKDQRGGKLFLSLAPQLIKGVSIHYLRFS